MSVKMYGFSDDLIEFEGDIDDEAYAVEPDNGPTYLSFSDGTVIKVVYDGTWKFSLEVQGAGRYELTYEAPDENCYSDKVTLHGDIKWVVVGGMSRSEA